MTTKFGHLVAPMAVQYVVVPNHNAPTGSGAAAVATPDAFLAGLQLQTDLQVVNVDPNFTVYKNAAWAPVRAVLPAAAVPIAAASGAAGARPLQQIDLSGAAPVLTGGTPSRAHGEVPAGDTVYVAATRQGGWRLRVGSTSIRPQPAFGWAMSFAVPATATGRATLQAGPSLGWRVGQIVEIALWVLAVTVASIDLRRRRSEHPPTETVRPEWFVPMAPAAERVRWRRGGQGAIGADDLKGDEVWIDV